MDFTAPAIQTQPAPANAGTKQLLQLVPVRAQESERNIATASTTLAQHCKVPALCGRSGQVDASAARDRQRCGRIPPPTKARTAPNPTPAPALEIPFHCWDLS